MSKPIRVSNWQAGACAAARKLFVANNIYSEQIGEMYVVYSYGPHFPLYIYDAGEWYVNSDSYSRTTAKHRHNARPGSGCIEQTTEQMRARVDAVHDVLAA